MARLLNDMPLERADHVFLHPMHQEAFGTLVSLIASLRRFRTYQEFYEFQQDLLSRIMGSFQPEVAGQAPGMGRLSGTHAGCG
jgi:hypothetical protein